MTKGQVTTTAADAAKAAAERFRFERVERVKDWCKAHYLSNPTFTDAARMVGMSQYHFHREFHAVAGETFKQYVDGLRIAEAQRRLLAGEHIRAVARALMFSHQSHFTSRFKLLVGETPRAWRQRALIAQGGMGAVSVAALADELDAIQRGNAANAEARRAALKAADDVRAGEDRLRAYREQAATVGSDAEAAVLRVAETLEKRIAQLRREAEAEVEGIRGRAEEQAKTLAGKIAAGEKWLADAAGQRDRLAMEAAALTDAEPLTVRQRMADAEKANRKVAANRARADVAARLAEAEGRSARLTAAIERLDAAKQAALAAAAFPVPGLSFDEGGVVLNGVPFDQASAAEQLRVSVAMGLALNPKLKVLLIRDGSLLDAESLAAIGSMAEAADAQVWIERVADGGGGCGVVIEDGCVANAKDEVAA